MIRLLMVVLMAAWMLIGAGVSRWDWAPGTVPCVYDMCSEEINARFYFIEHKKPSGKAKRVFRV